MTDFASLKAQQLEIIDKLQGFIKAGPPDQMRDYFGILGQAVDQYATLNANDPSVKK